jgi:hypothetical protein
MAAVPIVNVHTGSDAAEWLAAIGTVAATFAAVLIAVWSQHGAKVLDWERERDRLIRDYDETRRLLVMVIHRSDALQSPDLFGSLVHALAWHSWLIDAERAAELLNNYYRDRSSRDELDQLVNDMTERLDYTRGLRPLAKFYDPREPG